MVAYPIYKFTSSLVNSQKMAIKWKLLIKWLSEDVDEKYLNIRKRFECLHKSWGCQILGVQLEYYAQTNISHITESL